MRYRGTVRQTTGGSGIPILRNTHLAIQVKQIECKQADADFDVLHLHVLALPSAELLEWEQLRRVLVDGHRLSVKYERLRTLFDALLSMRSATQLLRRGSTVAR